MTKLEAYRILIEMRDYFMELNKKEAIEIALDSMNLPSGITICRDCKYWIPCGRKNDIKRTGECELHNMGTTRSYYCADGEVSQ